MPTRLTRFSLQLICTSKLSLHLVGLRRRRPPRVVPPRSNKPPSTFTLRVKSEGQICPQINAAARVYISLRSSPSRVSNALSNLVSRPGSLLKPQLLLKQPPRPKQRQKQPLKLKQLLPKQSPMLRRLQPRLLLTPKPRPRSSMKRVRKSRRSSKVGMSLWRASSQRSTLIPLM